MTMILTMRANKASDRNLSHNGAQINCKACAQITSDQITHRSISSFFLIA